MYERTESFPHSLPNVFVSSLPPPSEWPGHLFPAAAPASSSSSALLLAAAITENESLWSSASPSTTTTYRLLRLESTGTKNGVCQSSSKWLRVGCLGTFGLVSLLERVCTKSFSSSSLSSRSHRIRMRYVVLGEVHTTITGNHVMEDQDEVNHE